MRGYLAFVLVFFSLLLVFSMLEAVPRHSEARALLVERSYLLSMNVKESILESLRQGARGGFEAYDLSHERDLCIRCPPCEPRLCDPELCGMCFREGEAREAARQGALSALELLKGHSFDPDFSVSIGDARITVHLEAGSSGRNGLQAVMLRVEDDIGISVSSGKFGSSSEARIPGGVIVDIG